MSIEEKMWHARERSKRRIPYCLIRIIVFFSMFLMITPQQFSQYHFIKISKTWTEAQSFCREKYIDLATTANMDNQKAMMAAVDSGFSGPIWIGLERKGTMRWLWSEGIGPVALTYWNIGEPNNSGGNEACGMIGTGGLWNDAPCTSKFNILCYQRLRNGVKSYHVVPDKYTWNEGQAYCRTYYTDLASVTSPTDQQLIATAAGGMFVWIGLFRDTWSWSIGGRNSFRMWAIGKPDNYGEGCTGVYMNPKGVSGYWDDWSCGNSLPFLCFDGLNIKRRLVKLRMSSAVDLSDLEVRDQLQEQMRAVLAQQGVSNFSLSWRRVEEVEK